ncbi:MAG TPA: ATP-binding protein [Chitinophagales bacterium]|nr:ATP-binding protein [Chitinophagales bacterium]
MIYKVCITGTESTGKSTLAEKLSIYYKTVHVPDYSRYYIDQLSHKYGKMDVLEIAHGIIEQEDRMIRHANRFFFTDNCLINIKIWLQYYNWEVPAWLEEQIAKRKYHLWLLCDIDLTWVPDEQRSNPNDRMQLFGKFKSELEKVGANFHIVRGTTPQQRLAAAVQYIDSLPLVVNK